MGAVVVPLAEREQGVAGVTARAETWPETGRRWAEHFAVEAEVGEGRWRARRVETGERVELRSVRAGGDTLRGEAWARLREIELGQLAQAMERIAVGGDWVEVAGWPEGETLRDWRARRGKVEVVAVESVTAQVAEALGALHAHGLVHLGLTAGTIFVRRPRRDCGWP